MNLFTRVVWIFLNVFFGASLAFSLFIWGACDMQIPLILTDFLSKYLPPFMPLFRIPYVKIDQLSSSVGFKLIFNAFLYGIFGFLHTLFAQEVVQSWLGRVLFPKQTLRTFYCLLVTITVFIMMGFWQHTEVQLWNVLPSTMSTYNQQLVQLFVFSIIYAPGIYVVLKFDPWEFCGMKQLFERMMNPVCPLKTSMSDKDRTTGTPILVTSGLFRLCRHPLYLFSILAWSITPVMSLDRLALIIYTCIYASIAIPIEEQKLVQFFGQSYIDYQRRVPAIVPFTKPKSKRN